MLSSLLRAGWRRRAGDEQGAVLVMCVLALTGLLIVAGLVVDIALVRTDRQQNKSAADVAVAAGMRSLEISGYPAPFRGVCEAVKYLKLNHPELSAMTGYYTDGAAPPNGIPGDPCLPNAPEQFRLCAANAQATWAWYHGTADGGRVTVDVKNGYNMSDGSFVDEPLSSTDIGDPKLGNCDNFAVIITESETAGFGRLASQAPTTTRTRSVGRISQSFNSQAIIALLLLERHDCNVLSFNGTNSAVQVRGHELRPGIIHADSIGDGDNCNNKVLNGVSASTGSGYAGPSILAEAAETGVSPDPPAPGAVSVTALSPMIPGESAMPARAATACPSTVKGGGNVTTPYTCPIGSTRKGRINVDILYRTRMMALRADAVTKTSWNPAQIADAVATDGWTYYDRCNDVPATVTARKVFIHCATFNNAVTFSYIDPAVEQQVVFDGTVSGSNNMTFLNRTKLYIANGLSRSGGTFNVNTGGAATCPSGTRANSAKIVIAKGGFSSTGSSALHLCNTAVLMGDDSHQGGSCPNLPAIPTTHDVAPYDNCFNGSISLSGGGALDWTAPNATATGTTWDSPASQPYLDNFEGLAFWTETAGNANSLSGGGSNNMVGIFFLPNADSFHITGNGGQVIESDAQFIVRKLEMGGNGVLRMKPNDRDAISFPYFSDWIMVR
jgi:hypothetical protein